MKFYDQKKEKKRKVFDSSIFDWKPCELSRSQSIKLFKFYFFFIFIKWLFFHSDLHVRKKSLSIILIYFKFFLCFCRLESFSVELLQLLFHSQMKMNFILYTACVCEVKTPKTLLLLSFWEKVNYRWREFSSTL